MIARQITSEIRKELLTDKVVVLTGMRRVGKTTLIKMLYEEIKGKRKLYLDLENPLNQSLFTAVDFDKIKVNLEHQAVGKGKKLTIFLDEIQNVSNIPSVVKYLTDHFKIKFVLTGSASFYLKNLFSESLAGRKRIFELFPLNFEEFLAYKNSKLIRPGLKEKVDKYIFNSLDKYITEYLQFGGFPSVVLKKTGKEKRAEIEDIFTSYFQKEIQVLSDFRKLEVMKETIMLLLNRVGGKIDISKIASELGVSRITIGEYLDFLQGTYFLNRIKKYSKSIDVSLRSQAKLYFADSGLVKSMAEVSLGSVLENTIFNLLKQKGKLYYYQSKGGTEIDFILQQKRKFSAFEVKTYADKTDVRRLQRTALSLGIKNYYVVALKYSGVKGIIYPFQL